VIDAKILKLPAIDWIAVRRRLRLVRAPLDLPPKDVETIIDNLARGDETKLIEFAEAYGQSLEWIIRGDVVPMLRKLAGPTSNQLALPLEEKHRLSSFGNPRQP